MKFSVLLSVYVKEKVEHLKQSLESITTNQTMMPNEIIIVKDGKLNNNLDMVLSYYEKLSYGFMNKYYFIIFCLFTTFIFIYFLLLRNHQLFLFLVILISHLSNMFIICLGAPMLTRYKFYTEVLLLLISLSIIIHYLNPKKKNK